MSSFYSSLDWVFVALGPFYCVYILLCLSLCILCLFLTAYLLCYCERGGVDLMKLKSNPKDLSFFSALTLLVGSFDRKNPSQI